MQWTGVLPDLQIPCQVWSCALGNGTRGVSCKCPKPVEDTLEAEPLALPETVKPRPVYPCPPAPYCKKCDTSHIKCYCPNFTCPYCWTMALRHWPNKCPRKMFQKYWWKKGTKRNKDLDSTQSWDDCHGFYNISVRGHPYLYVPLYIPYLSFIFHLHFTLLTFICYCLAITLIWVVVSRSLLYLIITGTPLLILAFAILSGLYRLSTLFLESVSSYFAGCPDNIWRRRCDHIL